MDVVTLHHRAVETWAERVCAVSPEQWDAATPCRAWSVRDLVGHVTAEDRWTEPLLAGETPEEVGDRLDGDLLGDDPVGHAAAAAARAAEVAAAGDVRSGTVTLSYGPETVEEYLRQLAADHLVHAWDLAVATGGDPRLDPVLVREVAAWFAERAELYRDAGVTAAPRHAAPGDAQAALLAAFGRDPTWGPGHAAVARLSDAFGRRDTDAVMAVMSEDCVFEATSPPDGHRFEGAEAVRAVWDGLFAKDVTFEEEDLVVLGDRAVLLWRYGWSEPDGTPGHVRGVDVLRLRDGLVVEKLSYVKG